MRKVHDILTAKARRHDIVLSFIQHGNTEDGYVYENICPWCAGTIEMVTVHPEAEMPVVLSRLREGMSKHIWTCVRRGSYKIQVEKTSAPLDTEKVIKTQ